VSRRAGAEAAPAAAARLMLAFASLLSIHRANDNDWHC
jgi:hypothetical protein